MINAWSKGHTVIDRLQLRGAAADPLQTQLQLTHMLGAMNLHPNGLPTAALLYIRHLHHLLSSERAVRHRPLKETAIIAAMARLARQAARPLHESVPANAEAVIFADRSELLACLAMDWIKGQATARWWWQSLFKNREVTLAVHHAWLAAPEYAPAAIDYLAAHQQAIPFVGSLPAGICQMLLQRIIHCFGLTSLQRALETGRQRPVSAGQDGGVASQVEVDQQNRPLPLLQREADELPPVPWQPWVHEGANRQLTGEQQGLLGIGLMLRRAPMIVRSDSFATAVQQWRHPAPAPSTFFAAGKGRERETASVEVIAAEKLALQGISVTTQEEPNDEPPAAQPIGQRQTSGYRTEGVALGNPAPDLTDQQVDHAVLGSAARMSEERTSFASPVPAPFRPQVLEIAPTLAQEAQTAIGQEGVAALTETAYGGLFYLINLGLYLGLYADFTTPLTPGIKLDLYDFVALVGEQLLGEALWDDPVWGLLADLAGRSGDQPPGYDFIPADEQPLAAWLQGQMIVIRTRLLPALGCEDDPARLPSRLCVHQARVAVSATHIDVFFSLADLPIEIRLSGLDRNPGWVPAAGRYITFYFE